MDRPRGEAQARPAPDFVDGVRGAPRQPFVQDLPAALERFGRARPLVREVLLEALGFAVELLPQANRAGGAGSKR